MPTMPFQLFNVKTNYLLQVYLHLTTSKVVSHPFSSFTWNYYAKYITSTFSTSAHNIFKLANTITRTYVQEEETTLSQTIL